MERPGSEKPKDTAIPHRLHPSLWAKGDFTELFGRDSVIILVLETTDQPRLREVKQGPKATQPEGAELDLSRVFFLNGKVAARA